MAVPKTCRCQLLWSYKYIVNTKIQSPRVGLEWRVVNITSPRKIWISNSTWRSGFKNVFFKRNRRIITIFLGQEKFWEKRTQYLWVSKKEPLCGSSAITSSSFGQFRYWQCTKKWSFPLRIFSVNVAKSAVSCGFGRIYWRNLQCKTSFFVQCETCEILYTTIGDQYFYFVVYVSFVNYFFLFTFVFWGFFPRAYC